MSIQKVKNEISGDFKWEVRVYENGRGSKRVCRRFDKKVEAEEWLLEFEKKKSDVARNPFLAVTFENRYFKDEAEYWLIDAETRFSPGHLVKSKATVKEFSAKFKNLAIDQITPEFLTRYQQGELKKGSKPATVNRKTEVVTAILNHSAKHRRIPFNPTLGFRKLKNNSKEMEFWDQTEAGAFLKMADDWYPKDKPNRWIYAVYLIALNTGLRAGEIWALRPSDFAEAQHSIIIKRQFNRVSREFGPTKGRKPRAVPCNAALLEEIKELIRKNKVESHETIFRNKKGNPFDHDHFKNRIFAKDIKRWGGRVIRFHDFRHTATTLMIASGVDLKTVKEICGHKDISTTMNYVHLVSGAIEKVAMNFSILPKLEEKKRNLQVVNND